MREQMRRMGMVAVAVLLIPFAVQAVTVTESFDSYTNGNLNGQGAAGGVWVVPRQELPRRPHGGRSHVPEYT